MSYTSSEQRNGSGHRQIVTPSTSTQLPDPPDCLLGLGDGCGVGFEDGCGAGVVVTGTGLPDAAGAGPGNELVVVFAGVGAGPDDGADPRGEVPLVG
jgi:hypothetical protein